MCSADSEAYETALDRTNGTAPGLDNGQVYTAGRNEFGETYEARQKVRGSAREGHGRLKARYDNWPPRSTSSATASPEPTPDNAPFRSSTVNTLFPFTSWMRSPGRRSTRAPLVVGRRAIPTAPDGSRTAPITDEA